MLCIRALQAQRNPVIVTRRRDEIRYRTRSLCHITTSIWLPASAVASLLVSHRSSSQDCSGTYPILLAVSIRSSTTTLSACMFFTLVHTLMPLSHSLEEVLTHVSVSVVPVHAPDALVRCFLTRIIVLRNTLAVEEPTSARVRDLVHHSVALDC